MGILAVEDHQWILTLYGYQRHHPPTDPRGFLAFAETIAPPDVFTAIRHAQPLGGIAAYRFPASVRRRYERLRHFPAGLLVFGDAICGFNPVYAQGISAAALQAAALRDCLTRGDHDPARRFFRAAAKPVRTAWKLAVGADLTLPEVEGPRPLLLRMTGVYIDRYQSAAEHDIVLTAQLFKVAGLLEPSARLLYPSTILRVMAGNLHRKDRGGTTAPAPAAEARTAPQTPADQAVTGHVMTGAAVPPSSCPVAEGMPAVLSAAGNRASQAGDSRRTTATARATSLTSRFSSRMYRRVGARSPRTSRSLTVMRSES